MPQQYFEPRFPFCVTGDGHIIQIRSKTEKSNENGVEGFDVIISPSEEVIAEYGFQPEDFDENGFIQRWYPKSVFKTLRDDPVKGMYLLYATINGQETSLSRSIIVFREIIEGQQKHVNVLKTRNAKLWYDMKMMMSQQEEYLRKNVELLKQVKRLQGGFEDDDYGLEQPSGEMPR